jgi:hypothetical protein
MSACLMVVALGIAFIIGFEIMWRFLTRNDPF